MIELCDPRAMMSIGKLPDAHSSESIILEEFDSSGEQRQPSFPP